MTPYTQFYRAGIQAICWSLLAQMNDKHARGKSLGEVAQESFVAEVIRDAWTDFQKYRTSTAKLQTWPEEF